MTDPGTANKKSGGGLEAHDKDEARMNGAQAAHILSEEMVKSAPCLGCAVLALGTAGQVLVGSYYSVISKKLGADAADRALTELLGGLAEALEGQGIRLQFAFRHE